MDSIVNSVKSQAHGIAEMFTPVLKESKFRETGVLTPEEFTAAGDHLVYHCPTWQWASGDPNKAKPYLSPDKQFLITRNVPCYRRVKQLESTGDTERTIESNDVDDGWVDTHAGVEPVAVASMVDSSGAMEDVSKLTEQSDEEGEPLDMEEFEESGMLDNDDPNRFDNDNSAGGDAAGTSQDDNVIATRTYDLNITYDKYYQTPRMWLSGYDENRKPLTVNQMYEDFSADHANKTITMETHSHLNGPPMASIHPCRHAELMKKLISIMAESNKELGVHQYLLIFLKFVQAVIPTIEYDYTRNVQL